MKTEQERIEIIRQASKEIQDICAKYQIEIEAQENRLFVTHNEKQGSRWNRYSLMTSFVPF